MTQQTLAEALALRDDGDGGLVAHLTGDFSNAPQAMPQDKGAPFGGLMTALAAGAMRQGLGIDTPLQSLSIQFLAAARFEDCRFTPTMARGGRSVAYASVNGGQGERLAIQALGTFGRDVEGPVLTPLVRSMPAIDSLEDVVLDPALYPWLKRYTENRFIEGDRLFGQNNAQPSEVSLWMRTTDHVPLDEARLLFMLDAIYPTYWTALPTPPIMAASVDLRVDMLTDLTPEVSPEGWALFRFTTRDVGSGWAVEDGVAWAPDGRPIAMVRQRRKLLPTRG